MPIYRQDIMGLQSLESRISQAKDADPLDDLIYMAEFHADMVRRHIAACVVESWRNTQSPVDVL